jgi:L-asparaginase
MTGDPLVPSELGQQLITNLPELQGLIDLDVEIISNLDSSDIGPEIWTALAERIAECRTDFDGFLITHGTDTMAYTASALSFALEGLDRPVILTGAQRPLSALRSDARRNLTDAAELATLSIPEVGICFDGLLLRGCRATKSNTRAYHAFDSPGCQPLAKLGVDVELSPGIRRPVLPFRCDSRFDPRVAVVFVTPGLTPALLEHLIDAGSDKLRGIVLAAFGAGTLPAAQRPLAPVIKKAVDGGIDVLVANQSAGMINLGLYENSKVLADAGAIGGGQMMLEAAVAKLMHALSVFPRRSDRLRYLLWNMAGEME